jgi:hypothetical protein
VNSDKIVTKSRVKKGKFRGFSWFVESYKWLIYMDMMENGGEGGILWRGMGKPGFIGFFSAG